MFNEILLPKNSKFKKMGLAKLSAILGASLNVFLYLFAWISNLDNVKSTILFIVALSMSMYRFYRWAINSWQNKRLKDLAIQEREIEVINKRLEQEQHRVELVEREITVMITGRTKEDRDNNKKQN